MSNIYNDTHFSNNTNKEDKTASIKLDERYKEDYTKFTNYIQSNKTVDTYCDKETENK